MCATPDPPRRRARGRRLATVALVVLVATPAFAAAPYDWPQLRGPERDGISRETGLLERWPAEGPPVLWRRPLGNGFSALSVVDGTIYTQAGIGDDEVVVALAADDGRELWRTRLDRARPDGQGSGPRSTPLVDGDRLYAVSAHGTLAALERASGKLLWQRQVVERDGGRVPDWGVAASPLLDGDRLIFNVGAPDAAVIAYDKRTGEPLWRAGSDVAGYSTPILVEVGGLRQAIVFSGRQLLSLDPETGAVHWTLPWKTSYDVNAATPIFVPPNKLYVSSGYDTGAALFQLGATGGKATVQELWRSRRIKNQFSSAIYHGGHFYGFDNKLLKCSVMASGEDCWAEKGFGHGSLLMADGRLIVLSDRGALALVEASPDGYVELGRLQLAEGKHWTVPTLWDGRLFVRNERELVALDLRAASPASSAPDRAPSGR